MEDLQGEELNSLLRSHGIGLPRQALVATAGEAATKAKEIGFPVALKLVAEEIVHKTESGAVLLGLKNPAEVEEQGKQLLAKAPGKAQLLVQEMVQGTEVLLGARTDPQYGPFLMVGLGGILVEVLKDVTIRLVARRRATKPGPCCKNCAATKSCKGFAGKGHATSTRSCVPWSAYPKFLPPIGIISPTSR